MSYPRGPGSVTDPGWFAMVRGQAETIACPTCEVAAGETCINVASIEKDVLNKQPAHEKRIRLAGGAV